MNEKFHVYLANFCQQLYVVLMNHVFIRETVNKKKVLRGTKQKKTFKGWFLVGFVMNVGVRRDAQLCVSEL